MLLLYGRGGLGKTFLLRRYFTAGRNNEALEQVVMRLSIEDDVSNLSWTAVQTAIE